MEEAGSSAARPENAARDSSAERLENATCVAAPFGFMPDAQRLAPVDGNPQEVGWQVINRRKSRCQLS
jgi:hypothetical protein